MMSYLTHYPTKLYFKLFLLSRRCHLQASQSRSWIPLPQGNNQVGGGRVFRIDSGQKQGWNRNKLFLFWKGYCICMCLGLCLIVTCLFISFFVTSSRRYPRRQEIAGIAKNWEQNPTNGPMGRLATTTSKACHCNFQLRNYTFCLVKRAFYAQAVSSVFCHLTASMTCLRSMSMPMTRRARPMPRLKNTFTKMFWSA